MSKENVAYMDLNFMWTSNISKAWWLNFSCAGCGSRRRFRESSPSNPEGPQVADDDKKAFVKSMPIYRQ